MTAIPTTPAAARPTPGRRGGRPRSSLRKRVEIALFCTPALLLYIGFVIVPMGMAVFYSPFKWNGLEPLDNFIGLDNYKRALSDDVFQGAIWHNGLFIILSLAIQLPIGLGLALLVNRRIRGRALLRTILFAPYVISEVVAAVAWQLLLQPDGPVDSVLRSVGLGRLVQLWLADSRIVIFTLFLVITWKYIGFAIILFLAGLQGIPRELQEAAAIDGAGPWKVTRHITLPLLGPTIRTWIFLSIIGSLQLFDLIWIMTLGGPAGASNTMVTYIIERGFIRSQFGYGSAVAVILFVIAFVFALTYQRFVLRRDTEGAMTRMVG
jgi:raffinose/stachyose/melibiose transport system permease protein